jgi:hypothetical protein
MFENVLLDRILREVRECRLLHDEQLGFRPKHSTSLQRVRLFETVNRDTDDKRPTGAVSLGVAKAFFYKEIFLDIPIYLVKTISSYMN